MLNYEGLFLRSYSTYTCLQVGIRSWPRILRVIEIDRCKKSFMKLCVCVTSFCYRSKIVKHAIIKDNISNNIQGDPNQNSKFLFAISLKLCYCDLILVKPKFIRDAYIYSENCKQTAEKSK